MLPIGNHMTQNLKYEVSGKNINCYQSIENIEKEQFHVQLTIPHATMNKYNSGGSGDFQHLRF